LQLSLVPTIGVAGVRFGNPPWTEHNQLITVERVEARLAVLPLFRGEATLKHLTVEGARVMLETDRDGRGNWLLEFKKPAIDFPVRASMPQFDLVRRRGCAYSRSHSQSRHWPGRAASVAALSAGLARYGSESAWKDCSVASPRRFVASR
jgi:uncharacterized protein involved in outer membrane biogenesis